MGNLNDPEFVDEIYGSKAICHASQSGHEPDWKSVTTEWDGDTLYLDVPCMHCGRSGCIGTVKSITKEINW